MTTLDRREFLKCLGIGACGLAAASCNRLLEKISPVANQDIPGSIVGARFSLGHRLRERLDLVPTKNIKTDVLIIGGGVAGLSAAWRLKKSGIADVLVCELENEVGGSARSGENSVSPYPWGAHYLPIPNDESEWVREMLVEFGVITGRDVAGRTVYNDLYVCHDPDERLYIRGTWQDGIVPNYGIAASELAQTNSFFALMEKYRRARGRDGRLAFAIPIALSSHDPQYLSLDKITMDVFLKQNGFTAPSLIWYVNYCCRDDYGTTLSKTSAWAGIHYFAGRRGIGAGLADDSVLTWPAGNGWLVDRLKERLGGKLHPNALVVALDQDKEGISADFLNPETEEVTRVSARTAVYAAPRFTFPFVWRGTPSALNTYAFTYAPWMVANITLSRVPEGRGRALSWDNVFYQSASLGYVVATHQSLRSTTSRTVITTYLPLSHTTPANARREALACSFAKWRDLIVKDLQIAHPDIRSSIENIDVWLWGHGMIRPTPGFIWGTDRAAAQAPLGRIFFAHSDMSGISIFEEAQYHGIRAAEAVIKLLV